MNMVTDNSPPGSDSYDLRSIPGRYPGLGHSLRFCPARYSSFPIGVHENVANSASDILQVREVAMMSVMDRLTDKVDWHKKIFDDQIVSKWRSEALEIPDEEFWNTAWGGKYYRRSGLDPPYLKPLTGIMNANAFDCCVKELRIKAHHFQETGIIPTLDASASVSKSDTIVSDDLHALLSKAFDILLNDQAAGPDWHPKSNNMVRDLVHPSIYPLIYGQTKVVKHELVGVKDAIEKWSNRGDIISKPESTSHQPPFDGIPMDVSDDVPREYWSETYQWLPANVSFQDNGSVKFTSYINNLHPNRYPQIYHTIESLVQTALPAWDQCLAMNVNYNQVKATGRNACRLKMPDDLYDSTPDHWDPPEPTQFSNFRVDWKNVPSVYQYDPEMDEDLAYNEFGSEDETEEDAKEEGEQNAEEETEGVIDSKWKWLRKPVIPEATFEEIDYAPNPSELIAQRFAKSGLQIIVKMASIELTPEKPEFPAGSWHVEGQMNEHICGTALYYVDCENVTPSSLHFRMQTDSSLSSSINTEQDGYRWMESIYGTQFGNDGACLQNYGSVETKARRLLAFPNVFQHRVSSFRLEDPTKPGHRRFIALWLVDPNLRIISTANVPPQQRNWWMDQTFGQTQEARKTAFSKLPAEIIALLQDAGVDSTASGSNDMKLPPELMQMVSKHFKSENDKGSIPMGLDEAREHRLALMEERSAFVTNVEHNLNMESYNFCEH